MPLHDWQCLACGALVLDRYQPLVAALPPVCPAGCAPVEDVASGVGGGSTMEVLLSSGTTSVPFKEITVDLGQGSGSRCVTLTSLSQLRRLERDSISAWERGDPGAQPLIFKNFSDDHSNWERSLFEEHFSERLRRPAVVDHRRAISGPSGRRKIEIRAARIDPGELGE